jgi:hypothetical protein
MESPGITGKKPVIFLLMTGEIRSYLFEFWTPRALFAKCKATIFTDLGNDLRSRFFCNSQVSHPSCVSLFIAVTKYLRKSI